MMKDMLLKFLFKRGVGQLQEWLSKGIRHGATMYGGMLMQSGYATADEVELLTGGAVALAGVLLSVARIYMQKKLS